MLEEILTKVAISSITNATNEIILSWIKSNKTITRMEAKTINEIAKIFGCMITLPDGSTIINKKKLTRVRLGAEIGLGIGCIGLVCIMVAKNQKENKKQRRNRNKKILVDEVINNQPILEAREILLIENNRE